MRSIGGGTDTFGQRAKRNLNEKIRKAEVAMIRGSEGRLPAREVPLPTCDVCLSARAAPRSLTQHGQNRCDSTQRELTQDRMNRAASIEVAIEEGQLRYREPTQFRFEKRFDQ